MPPRLAALRGLALDVEALVLPVACLHCGGSGDRGMGGRGLCGPCRVSMRTIAHPKCARCGQTRDTWDWGMVGQGDGKSAPRTAIPPSPHPPGVCGFCRTWPEALAWADSAVWYEDAARALVRALKYGGWRVAAGPMAEIMMRQLGARILDADLIVPIPLGRLRLRERGHNQAEVLADCLGGRPQGSPQRSPQRSWPSILERTRETKTQTALHPLQRRDNVRGAFVVRRESCVAGMKVVLVDDVLTTGATLGAAAEALAAAGAASVGAVTFARALKPE